MHTILCVSLQSLVTVGCRAADPTLFQQIRAHLIALLLSHGEKPVCSDPGPTSSKANLGETVLDLPAHSNTQAKSEPWGQLPCSRPLLPPPPLPGSSSSHRRPPAAGPGPLSSWDGTFSEGSHWLKFATSTLTRRSGGCGKPEKQSTACSYLSPITQLFLWVALASTHLWR